MESNVYFKRGHGVDFAAQPPEGYIRVRIPFDGFYESLLSAELDLVVDYEKESGIDVDARYSDVYADEDEVGKIWLNAVKELFKLDTPIYIGIWRPKEYNFYTDELYAYVKYDDLARMVKECSADSIASAVADATTPRDGYAPFYKAEDVTWEKDMPEPLWQLAFEGWMDTNDVDMTCIYFTAFDSPPLGEIVHWVERKPEPQEQEAS